MLAIETSAFQTNVPGIGLKQTANHHHGRGLTGTIGPQKSKSLSLFNLKAQLVNRFQVSERFAKSIYLQKHAHR
jgi:hypothetical protein